ncbi:MAG: hypothetical protein R3F61_05150 [Myxococcota bacterium]
MLVLVAAALATPTYSSFSKDPRDTLLADRATPAGFRIIALSHLAEACGADGDVGCVERVARAAVHPSIRPVDPNGRLADHGLYLSHLALILGTCAAVGGSCDADLHRRVSEHLAARSVRDGVIASFPGEPRRYPADQAVTLRALQLYDSTRGTDVLPGALGAYRALVDAATEASGWGLPPSELTGAEDWSSVPRGCALASTVQYLAPVDPDYARQVWKRAKKQLYVQVGPVSGLREWPLGEEREADADSGPIVLGVGAAATAFGIGAAYAMGDPVAVAQLEGTEWLVRKQGHPAGDSALAVAISAASPRRSRE